MPGWYICNSGLQSSTSRARPEPAAQLCARAPPRRPPRPCRTWGDLPSLLCLPQVGPWGDGLLGFGLSGVGRSELGAGPVGVVSVGEGASRAGCFPGARGRPRCFDSVTCCSCSVRSSNSRFCCDSINMTGARAVTPAPPQAGLSAWWPTPAGPVRPGPCPDLNTAVFLLP